MASSTKTARLATRSAEHSKLDLPYGCSAAHILSATNASHIAIDAYEGYGNLGLINIVKLGLQGRFQLIKLPSHLALPQLLMSGTAVDFALIDGGHKFEETSGSNATAFGRSCCSS
jgi:hypothetical protein